MDDLLLLLLFVAAPIAAGGGAMWAALWLLRRYELVTPDVQVVLDRPLTTAREWMRLRRPRLPAGKLTLPKDMKAKAPAPPAPARSATPVQSLAARPFAKNPAEASVAAPERLASIREILVRQWASEEDQAASPALCDRASRLALRLQGLGASPAAIAGALMQNEREMLGERPFAEDRALAAAQAICRLPR